MVRRARRALARQCRIDACCAAASLSIRPLLAGLPMNADPLAAFIFDLDGTLVDSMPYHVLAWAQLSDELGLGLSEAEVSARVFGISTREVARSLFGGHLPDAEQVRLGERKEAIFRAIYGPRMK